MQEHLIPQDVSNYRFHLIGELDLKQFVEVIVGIGLAVLVYQFNWPGFIKWPIMIFLGGLGIVAAFLPIADQPLSHWIQVFFKNLFSATRFYWQKEITIPGFFNYELASQYLEQLQDIKTFNVSPAKKHKALDYFSTLEKKTTVSDRLEVFNADRLQEVMSNFELAKSQPVAVSTSVPRTKIKFPAAASQSQTQMPTQMQSSVATPPVKKLIIKPQVSMAQAQRPRQIITPTQANVEAFLNNTSLFKPQTVTTQITDVSKLPQAEVSSGPSVKPRLHWPSTAGNLATTAPQPEVVLPAAAVAPTQASAPPATTSPIPIDTLPTQPLPTLATPVLPTDKQVFLSGKLVDKLNRPIASAIISLKDLGGNPRAILRTSEAGDFSDQRLLDPGGYLITAQKNNSLLLETMISVDDTGLPPLLLVSN